MKKVEVLEKLEIIRVGLTDYELVKAIDIAIDSVVMRPNSEIEEIGE